MEKRRWVRPRAAGFLVLVVVLSVAVVGAACGGGQSAGSGSGAAYSRSGTAVSEAGKPVMVGPAAQPAQSSAVIPVPPPAAEGPKVIRSGQVTLEVRTGAFDSAYSQLVSLAGEEGGVVSASNASTEGDRIRSGTVTLSVPSDRWQDTLDRLNKLGRVKASNTSTQDVSQQYVDLKARLANAEAERDAMLALLQKAQSVQDILAVQNQLGQYTQQVEQLKGQIDYLDHATSMWTIQVTLREAGAAVPTDEWGIATAFGTGLHAFVQTVNGLIVVLTVAGPYLLLAGLGWLLWRRRRRIVGRAV